MFLVTAFHMHTETYQASPDPSLCMILKAAWGRMGNTAWVVTLAMTALTVHL